MLLCCLGGYKLTTAREGWHYNNPIWQLVRHGKYERSAEGEALGLTKKGILDIVGSLANLERPEVIVTSPATRAKESAEVIAKFFHMDPREIIPIKGLEDVHITPEALTALRSEKSKKWSTSWIEGMHGIESLSDYLERKRKALKLIPRDKIVAWVGHEEDFWMMTHIYAGVTMEEAVKQDISNGNIVVYDLTDGYVIRALEKL